MKRVVLILFFFLQCIRMKIFKLFTLFPLLLFGMNLSLPNQFFLSPKPFQELLQFDVSSTESTIGSITKTPFFSKASFEFFDEHQQLLSQAESQYYCWGTIAQVFSPENEKIGWLEEQMFQWFTRPICRIFDRTDHLVAIAQKNYLGTKISIICAKDTDHTLAIIHRPWFRSITSNPWTIEVIDPTALQEKKLNPNLLIHAAAHHCDRELQAHSMPIATDQTTLISVHPFLGDDELFFKYQIQRQKQYIKNLIQTVSLLPYNRKKYKNEKEIDEDEQSVSYLFEQFEIEPLELPSYSGMVNIVEEKMLNVIAELHEIRLTIEKSLSLIYNPTIFEKEKQTVYSLLSEYIDQCRGLFDTVEKCKTFLFS